MPQVDTLHLQGSLISTPPGVPPSAALGFEIATIDETLYLAHKSGDSIDLTTDAPFSVPFAGLTKCNFLYIKSVGGKVRVRVTSVDGSQQSYPVSSLLILFADTNGGVDPVISAIDITRVAGQLTSVTYVIGEQAT